MELIQKLVSIYVLESKGISPLINEATHNIIKYLAGLETPLDKNIKAETIPRPEVFIIFDHFNMRNQLCTFV